MAVSPFVLVFCYQGIEDTVELVRCKLLKSKKIQNAYSYINPLKSMN